MSAVIHYGDLFFITLIPIIMQAFSLAYLWRIHRLIGKEMTWIFGIINVMLIIYDVSISFLLLFPSDIEDANQPIEFWGLFIAFFMPLGNAIAHLLMQMRLAKSLIPQ